MKIVNSLYKFVIAFVLLGAISCDSLDEINENPNGISPTTANPNLLLPAVMRQAALNINNLGYGDLAGTVQHTQKDGWFTGHNQYEWGLQDWNGWYDLLRNNRFIMERAEATGLDFHKGIALTMKSFIFGTVTDLWGDAPYTMALRGDQPGLENEFPAFDSQEVIYDGVINDLKAASQIFSSGSNAGIIPQYDLYFGGNVQRWHKFANSLLLRYYMRLSAKKPDLAKAGIEEVFRTGVFLSSADEDVVMNYIGASAADSWPSATDFDAGSGFRRIKPTTTLINRMLEIEDPRVPVWFRPVHCKWVEDPTLTTAIDPFIRENGVILQGRVSFNDADYVQRIAAGNVYTRHYNPALLGRQLDTGTYVGVPPALENPSAHNLNPTEGQQLENQHVSQLSDHYRGRSGGILKARIISAAEVHFILAEAAQRGWNVGNAQTHYNKAVKLSLDTWGVGSSYDDYIAKPGVAYNGSLEQIIEQKWIASWTTASESWFDFRRTGLPALVPGEASAEPVLPVRFTYGNNEINFNSNNVNNAISRLEVTFAAGRGANNQWSKPWLIQGTGKPW
nr:SusD/RagB family nutrient-binding outer membrane lipoprotein [Cytophagales bacterium]